LTERLSIEFNAIIDHVRVIRGALRSFLRSKEINATQVFDTELALSEAVVNVIKHTYRFEPTQTVYLTILWEPEERACTFLLEDSGKTVSPEKMLSRDLDDLKDHGLGVYIIKSLMDEVTYSPREDGSGNRLTMKKRFRP
jgi:serine/threonine-protein kinase RsbW